MDKNVRKNDKEISIEEINSLSNEDVEQLFDTKSINLILKTHEKKEKKITVIALIIEIKDKLWLLTILAGIFFVIGLGLSFLYDNSVRTGNNGSASALIMFGFTGAEEGLDPMGNAFNINQLASPYVIGLALDSLGFRELGISAEAVREGLRVNAINAHQNLELISIWHGTILTNPGRLTEIEPYLFSPTQFLLTIHHVGSLATLNSQQIMDLLNEIIYQYSNYFVSAYGNFAFLDVIMTHFDPDRHDFFEIIGMLNSTVNHMISYSNIMRNNAIELGLEDFQSPRTQMTFNDIIQGLNIIRNLELTTIASLVHVTNMSRDPVRAANILEYRVTRMNMDYEVYRANAANVLFLADDVFQHQTWFLAYDNFYEASRATEVYDLFLRDQQRLTEEANRLYSEISFYRNRISTLRSAPGIATPEEVAYVESSIPYIINRIDEWSDIINQTVQDFMTLGVFRDAIRVLTPANYTSPSGASNISLILITAVVTLLGFALGAVVVLYRYIMKLYQNF